MMAERPVPGPERPRIEPEIIPPGDARARWQGAFDGRATQRIYVARLGPFGFAMVALAVAFLAAVILILLLGAFLIWIPIAGLLLVIAVVTSMLRGSFRRR
jgi:hypothetical protein